MIHGARFALQRPYRFGGGESRPATDAQRNDAGFGRPRTRIARARTRARIQCEPAVECRVVFSWRGFPQKIEVPNRVALTMSMAPS